MILKAASDELIRQFRFFTAK